MTIIDSACKALCKCNYDSLDDTSSASATEGAESSSPSNPSEGFINYEKEVKGNEFRLLIFIIILLFIAKLIF